MSIASAELMFVLPEVAYLVDRVPLARLAIKADAVHLRFCQHARDSNMPLKEQCRILGIPWHGRNVHAELVSEAALNVVKAIPSSVFAQTYPRDFIAAKHWLKIVGAFVGGNNSRLLWLAHHALDARKWWSDIKPYLSQLETVPASLKAATMAERARAWKAEQGRVAARALELRREQMNLVEWAGPVGWGDDRNNLNAYRQAVMNQQYNAMNNRAYALQNDPYWQQAQNQLLRGAAAVRREPQDTTPIAYPERELAPFEHDGYTVQLLNTHEQFSEEGKRMHHCVEQYFPMAKRGTSRVVSVSKRGKRLITAEFSKDWELVQAKGAANKRIEANDPMVRVLRDYAANQKAPAAPAVPVAPAKRITFDPRSWGA